MNAKTLKALKGSVKKWEKIVAGTDTDQGVENCPLCKAFYHHEKGTCFGCPVYEKTGNHDCIGTPYTEKWVTLGGWYYTGDTQARKAAARAELAFLKSLLPRKRK